VAWYFRGRANAGSQIVLVGRVKNASISLNCSCVDLFNPADVSVSRDFDARNVVASSRSMSGCVKSKLRRDREARDGKPEKEMRRTFPESGGSGGKFPYLWI